MEEKKEINERDETKEYIPESKVRISIKGRPRPLPRLEFRSVQELFDLLLECEKDSTEEYEEIQESLDKFGYDPDKFTFVKLKVVNKLRVIDGRKRILLLHKKHPNRKIEIAHLKPIRKKVPNRDLKNKNEELLKKRRSERKNNNSKTSN